MTSEASPLYKPSVVAALKKCSLSDLFFITIKDNTQSDRWTKLGKVSDWLRRYYKTYIVVKGTANGIHFHALAGGRTNKRITYQKGVHFHTKNLHTQTTDIHYDPLLERLESIDKTIYYRRERFNRLTEEYLTTQEQDIAYLIPVMIRKEFKRRATNATSRVRRRKVMDKKEWIIHSVIKYLQKNLDEPRDDEILIYNDYILF